jgi:hypothetical protein
MPGDEPKYQRLTRARPRSRAAIVSSGNSSLWLGPDHVLCIDSTGYTENYKRFYFRDIQAILIRKTEAYKIWTLVLGVLAGIFALIAALTSDVTGKYVLGSIAGFFLLLAALYLSFGPTAACSVQTAVQTEAWPSLNRLRRARKVLNRLRPLIVGAQGELKPEEITLRFQQGSSAASGAGAPVPANPSYISDDPNAPPRIIS